MSDLATDRFELLEVWCPRKLFMKLKELNPNLLEEPGGEVAISHFGLILSTPWFISNTPLFLFTGEGGDLAGFLLIHFFISLFRIRFFFPGGEMRGQLMKKLFLCNGL